MKPLELKYQEVLQADLPFLQSSGWTPKKTQQWLLANYTEIKDVREQVQVTTIWKWFIQRPYITHIAVEKRGDETVSISKQGYNGLTYLIHGKKIRKPSLTWTAQQKHIASLPSLIKPIKNPRGASHIGLSLRPSLSES